MYTRSYPRQEPRKEPPPAENAFLNAPARRVLNENDIPKGYSGTAILRENESHSEIRETPTPPVRERGKPQGVSHVTRAIRLKAATKITPSLLHDPNIPETESENECENEKGSDTDCRGAFPKRESLISDSCQKECCDTDRDENGNNTEYEDSCTCEDKKLCHCASSQRRLRRIKRRCHLERRDEKQRPGCTQCQGLRDRSFSLEDLLLGGLILLMLNEGADDDVILMLGFLLFSAL